MLDALARNVVGVWGYGAEGKAAVAAAVRAGAGRIVVFDDVPTGEPARLIGATHVSFPDHFDALLDADIVVRSPGVSRYDPRCRLVAGTTEILGGTAIALRDLTRHHMVGVTGTKGKSTTASLISALATAVGTPAVLLGNIGRPLLDAVVEVASDQPLPVAEISSYQAADVDRSPSIGVLTSLYPEHLDWHRSVETYYADKLNLFRHRSDGVLVVLPQFSAVLTKDGSLGSRVRVLSPDDGVHRRGDGVVVRGELLPASAIGLQGRHNLDNICLALAALEEVGVQLPSALPSIAAALADFQPLAHRMQPVATLDGVTYYDDTLSTVPESTLACIQTFDVERPVTVIVGGQDRGLDYSVLAHAVRGRRRLEFVCVPDSGDRIGAALTAAQAGAPGKAGVSHAENLDEALSLARELAPMGGAVVLSPASPSYNRYRNYLELGSAYLGALDAMGAALITEAGATEGLR